MSLPQTFLIFRAISGALIKPPQNPNQSLNVGIFNENMASFPQVNFLTALSKDQRPPITNNKFDEGYVETEKGARTYSSQKDYYLGSPL